jgi:hypothetical protein
VPIPSDGFIINFPGNLIDVLLLRQTCVYDLRHVSLIAHLHNSASNVPVKPVLAGASTIDQLVTGIYEFALQDFLQWVAGFCQWKAGLRPLRKKCWGFDSALILHLQLAFFDLANKGEQQGD